MDELYLTSYKGGFVNGGIHQLERPNSFIVPQGRCAEYLLFSIIQQIKNESKIKQEWYIPNNGHFDTTEANIVAAGMNPVNMFSDNLFEKFNPDDMNKTNPFKGVYQC
jgi:tryptophanase